MSIKINTEKVKKLFLFQETILIFHFRTARNDSDEKQRVRSGEVMENSILYQIYDNPKICKQNPLNSFNQN